MREWISKREGHSVVSAAARCRPGVDAQEGEEDGSEWRLRAPFGLRHRHDEGGAHPERLRPTEVRLKRTLFEIHTISTDESSTRVSPRLRGSQPAGGGAAWRGVHSGVGHSGTWCGVAQEQSG